MFNQDLSYNTLQFPLPTSHLTYQVTQTLLCQNTYKIVEYITHSIYSYIINNQTAYVLPLPSYSSNLPSYFLVICRLIGFPSICSNHTELITTLNCNSTSLMT